MSENKRGKSAAFNLGKYSSAEVEKLSESISAANTEATPAEPVESPNIPAPEPITQLPAAQEVPDEPVEKEPASVAAPAPKSPARAGGRKAKAAPAAGKKKLADKKSYEKTVTVYMSEEEHMRYKISCIPLRMPLSDFFLQATRAYYRSTFVCADPNCGAEFTIQSNSDGETIAPAMCPCCGGKRISAVKF